MASLGAGTVVAAALYFIRFGLALNLLQLAVWLLLVVLPFIASPPVSFSWHLFTATPAQYLLQGYGLGSTFLFYGGYVLEPATRRARPDLAYPIAYLLAYAVTLLALLIALHRRIQGAGDVGGAALPAGPQLHPFCATTFAGWEWHAAGRERCAAARRALRARLQELVSDASVAEVFVPPAARRKALLRRALGLALLWPALMAATGAATYFAVLHAGAISRATHLSFAPALLVTGVSIAGSFLVGATVNLEAWPPRHQTAVAAAKLFTLKADYLAVLLVSLFRMRQTADATSVALGAAPQLRVCDPAEGRVADLSCAGGFVCCDADCAARLGRADLLARCIPGCVENSYAQTFYRLAVSNGLVVNLVDAAVAGAKRWLGARVPFEPHAVMIQTVESAVLVLLGSPFFPLLPLLGAAGNLVTFYTRLALAKWVHHPPERRTSASRTGLLAHLLMAGALVLSSFPVMLNLGWQRYRCGANAGSSMRAALVAAIDTGPSWVGSVLGFLVDPVMLITLVLTLLSAALLLRGRCQRLAAETRQLQEELRTARRSAKVATGKPILQATSGAAKNGWAVVDNPTWSSS